MKCSYCWQKISSWMESCPYCEKPNDGNGSFEKTIKKKWAIGEFFSFEWRYSRSQFCIYCSIPLIVWLLINFSIWFVWILLLLITIASVRRLHDLNFTWKFALILFIPFVNLGFIIYLIFAKGTNWHNKYWPDPLEKTTPTN